MKRKELTLNANVREIEKLPLLIDEICNDLNLPAALSFNLNLVLEEAVTNIIQYAYPDNTGKTISIAAEYCPESIAFTLTDSGIAFNPTTLPDADTSLSVQERPIGGLGFFLIRQIMDKVEYQRKGDYNILTLQKQMTKSQ